MKSLNFFPYRKMRSYITGFDPNQKRFVHDINQSIDTMHHVLDVTPGDADLAVKKT